MKELNPDVVTLDLIMPELDGVGFLLEQMARRPIPVVVVSIASESGEKALQALDAGAVDFVQKPTALATEKVLEIRDELIAKVKTAARVPVKRLIQHYETAEEPPVVFQKTDTKADAVVIGISTGGPHALKLLIPQFPADFPVPMAVVLHMPVGYTELFARQLDQISFLNVKEAEEGDPFVPGDTTGGPRRTSPDPAARGNRSLWWRTWMPGPLTPCTGLRWMCSLTPRPAYLRIEPLGL